MRIDHHAYQRATRVAGAGFLVQLIIGLTVLLFSLLFGETIPQDTTLLFGSLYVLLGLLAWLGLIVIFNQHRLERLEALEEDELASSRTSAGSVFERTDEEIRVAARRLRLMHKWLMPTLSLVIAAMLSLLWFVQWRQMTLVAEGEAVLHKTDHLGWAVAICLAASAISFIFSRFVAGMAKQPVWQNLRGGASWTVGTSIITLAIAVGLGFRFFDRDGVIETSAKAIPWFLLLLAGEIVFNFILNIYRPRVPGETPRPAFDSRILSLFAAPDNIVRSINEAVNYQFGFDVTSSWGYQLLLRSITRLVLLGVVVLIALNMIVIVEPDEQAVKLSRGRLLGDAHGSGVLWKLPWPLQSAETYSVSAVQELHLTPKHVRDVGGENVQLWTDDLSQEFDAEPEPFIVGNVAMRSDEAELAEQMAQRIGDPGDGGRQDILVNQVSLVDAEVVLQYRIKPEGGLLDYLRFSSDEIPRRGELPMRKQALKAIALREATQHFSRLRLDEVLQTRRLELASALEVRIQQAFDDHSTGIEVVAVNLPILAPSGDAAPRFEDVATARQNRLLQIAQARQFETSILSVYAGDLELVDEILAGIAEWERLRSERGPNAPETVEQRVLVENMLVDAGGQAAADIAGAERDRWVRLMEARTDAKRLAGQLAPYHAAPDLYRLRRLMGVYATTLNDLRKYVIGIDPSRVHMDFDITELNPLLNIGDAIPDQQGESES